MHRRRLPRAPTLSTNIHIARSEGPLGTHSSRVNRGMKSIVSVVSLRPHPQQKGLGHRLAWRRDVILIDHAAVTIDGVLLPHTEFGLVTEMSVPILSVRYQSSFVTLALSLSIWVGMVWLDWHSGIRDNKHLNQDYIAAHQSRLKRKEVLL